MKIALVHEFLNQLGGAERVLQNFLEIWPKATFHVLLYDKDKTLGQFENTKKQISFINFLPFAHKHPRLFVTFMPSAIEHFDFEDFDLVLSDSSSFAKGIKTDKLHICYCHAPTRYIWTAHDYIDNQQYPQALKWLGKSFLKRLKKWDYAAAQRVNFFIANSRNIQQQIKKYYDRDSIVIPPPVDTEFFHPATEKQDYFFTASRLEPYKKIDIIIQAFNDLGLRLKVAGSGTDAARLKSMAKPNIEFLGYINDEELRKYYSEAKAFVFAADEDAGIAPVEAQACGTPVIAYGKGGVSETVKPGVTGEFFGEQTAESLKQVLKSFDASKYDGKIIRSHALQYDKKIFQKMIKEFLEQKYSDHRAL